MRSDSELRAPASPTTFSLVVVIVIGLVSATVAAAAVEAGAFSGPGSAEGAGGAAIADGVGSSCGRASHGTCMLAEAGTNWWLEPPGSWCVGTNETVLVPGGTFLNGSGDNQTFTSTTWHCAEETMSLWFNATRASTLGGEISVNGPFQVWLLPVARSCELMGGLTHTALPCAPPVGEVPGYLWNTTVAAGTLNLSDLSFDFGSSPGVLPPLVWSLELVAIGSTAEAASVVSAVVLTSL
jgi:hypothetical protein